MDEPARTLHDPAELLAGYLDYYRDGVLRKLDGMSAGETSRSRLPSGWTPSGLLKHLAYMERRWLRWGFAAEQVDSPWGDQSEQRGSWHVGPDETVEDVKSFYLEQCARSREIAAGAQLSDRAAVGGRFESEEDTPTLAWILFHVLQEYARHLGHLDIVRELADGDVGE
jgi:uncharacterized damage-inducible protein DinB